MVHSEVLNSIIETGWKTSDVIEHIAKEAVDGQLSPRRLIQDLETAVYLLNKFELELKNSPSHLPSRDEINALKQDLLIRDKVKETPTSKQLSRALIPKAIGSLLSLIANIATTIRMNSAYCRGSLTNPNTSTNVMFLSDMLHNLHFLGRAIEEDDTCRLHIEIDKQIGCWAIAEFVRNVIEQVLVKQIASRYRAVRSQKHYLCLGKLFKNGIDDDDLKYQVLDEGYRALGLKYIRIG